MQWLKGSPIHVHRIRVAAPAQGSSQLPGRAAAVSLNPLCDVWSYRYCSYISYLMILPFIYIFIKYQG